jgi:2-oxoglutarate dehydrogenase E1 component
MTIDSGSERGPRKGTTNDVLEATSFLFGSNAGFIEDLYAQFLKDPSLVDGTWRHFFDSLGESGLNSAQLGSGPSWQNGASLDLENGELVSALTGGWPDAIQQTPSQQPSIQNVPAAATRPMPSSHINPLANARDSIRVIQMVRAFRVIGHLEADLDPLGLNNRTEHPQLQPSFYAI